MPEESSSVLSAPPDQHQRIAALDPKRSVIVQAPAGSGKTDLLTRRFLRLLAEVDDPKHIVAITFTRPAAAEMRHRILEKLEEASTRTGDLPADEFSMEALAARALGRSRECDWRLPDLASQLRISTIDSFCRELAIQQPIFSGIGNRLQISDSPTELYRAAARATLQKLGDPVLVELSDAIRGLLLWRDNGWKELEELLVKMLSLRDRWMHGFVLSQEKNWDLVREQLERPLANVVRAELQNLELLMDRVPGASEEAHELSQFACEHGAPDIHRDLAERADFPHGPHQDTVTLEDARSAYLCLADLLLTNEGKFRAQIDRRLGFPKEHRDKKLRLEDLIAGLSEVAGLEEALAGVRNLPPARYTDEDWQIIRASFILLRHAAGELKAIFAEAGAVDFIEVAQIARKVLSGEDQLPSDAALAVADDIHHLLVDEFQDTSRRQHEFVTSLIEAWPDSAGRTIFVVGDPMQSIYFFRDAEAALFRRVKERGFELSDGSAYPLSMSRLTSNFRTDPKLVSRLNEVFAAVFAEDDGSGIEFAEAEAARVGGFERRFELHLTFMPQARAGNSSHPDAVRDRRQIAEAREAAGAASTRDVVALIDSHLDRVEAARSAGQKYRIAVLGRARAALAPIAEALRNAEIPFRAVELETLKDQPEILDAVALTRALFNPQDRVAWLGVLRAPWCGLSLAEIHAIAGTDGESHSVAPIPQLLRDCAGQLPENARQAAHRVLDAFSAVSRMRTALSTASVGTLIQQIWRTLGGDRCANDTARANLDLFWKLLDKMPGGEQDLLGPALDSALEDLCALPDPATSSEQGVQLMTIHKSKGLEFEVVIVPELQAAAGGSKTELLSWMERGLVDPGNEGELTEFLIAPVQSKGDDPGKAKKWIDRLRKKAEAQEMRRILYVAGTRAREELHLFARPNYKRERDGSLTMPEPSKCLLATAWPALGEEIRARFEEWKSAAEAETAAPEIVIASIAAAGDDNLVTLPHPTILRRLPPGFEPESVVDLNPSSADAVSGLGDGNPYQRHEGGLHSRALGNAVHKLLEELARLRRTHEWPEARAALERFRPRILAAVRATGLTPAQAEKITAEAFQSATAATRDPRGQWILSSHADAASESEWAGIVGGTVRQVRVDRLFRAGLAPLQPGADALWIIDYKTAHVDNLEAASALPVFRAAFAPQLNMYAAVLRNLHGADTPLRAGLYYPRMSLFDWWEV